MLCSRCKKNVAVVFITKIEGEKQVNEGLCLTCARELGIQPLDKSSLFPQPWFLVSKIKQTFFPPTLLFLAFDQTAAGPLFW